MANQQIKLAYVLAEFGDCYDIGHSIWMNSLGLPADSRDLLMSPKDALRFFASYVHERGGANRRFSLFHRAAIEETYRLNPNIISIEFADQVYNRFIKFVEDGYTRPNVKLTEGPVKGVLLKLRQTEDDNLINYLKRCTLSEAYNWLVSIKGIKHKLASFLLRDIWSYIGPWVATPHDDLKYLQPIDRWVRFWAEKLIWRDLRWPTDGLQFAGLLVDRLDELEIDAIPFNKGAWFVGNHYDRLCQFFNLPEEETINYCIASGFDAKMIEKGIRNFNDQLINKIFWV